MIYKKREIVHAALYILPSFILISFFSLIPIVMNFYFAFTKYNVIQPPEWTGFSNFFRLIRDVYIGASLRNTVFYTIITVTVQTVLSLFFAALIAEGFKNKYGEFFRGTLFIPVISSGILVGTLWTLMLGARGPVNQILQLLHLPVVNWLGGSFSALVSVAITSIWKNLGYFLVIYYAGIMDIPVSLYEAARVDGAGGIQRFFYITLPSLRHITYLIVTLGTIWSFQVFDLVYTMTGGGPGMATVTLVLTTYRVAFKEYNMGYASMIALLLLFLILIISTLQKRFMRDGSGD
ncbi:MAG: sugar ABC transporter permease [Treponema sp.]|nr:sugar ABC transporter permease [Treponema sp.]